MSLYCVPCRQELVAGSTRCHLCGGDTLACMTCHDRTLVGRSDCPRCDVQIVVRRGQARSGVEDALATVPDGLLNLPRVPEVYDAGRYGVKAEVMVPPGDAAIMNELLKLVPLLHGMAARLNQFQGHTDHTRALIRDLRRVACDAQEEVELRRGPA